MTEATGKRSNWFVNYASTRNLAERIRHFVPSDFAGASVLDLGCNEGQMAAQAMRWGARSVLGIDYDRTAVEKARAMGIPGATFAVEDMDQPAFWRSIPQANVALLLAVYLTKELDCKEAILANAAAKATNVLYFEGHANETQGYRVQEYVRDIVRYTDLPNVEYIGDTDSPGFRPLFRCWRKPLTMLEAVNRLLAARKQYKRIVVVGKSAVGKSTLCEILNSRMPKPYSHAVYDDVPPPYGHDKFILFDWRGLEYVPDADCVFILTCDESERLRRIDGQPYKDRLLRTPPGKIESARAVFTVRT